MRVLLQDAATAEFLCLEGRTRNPAEAYNFGSTLAALRFTRLQPRGSLQILLKFDQEGFDMALPLRQLSGDVLSGSA